MPISTNSFENISFNHEKFIFHTKEDGTSVLVDILSETFDIYEIDGVANTFFSNIAKGAPLTMKDVEQVARAHDVETQEVLDKLEDFLSDLRRMNVITAKTTRFTGAP